MNGFHLYRKAWRFNGPPHREPHITREERRALLRKGGLLIRNTYDFDCNGKTSFWYIIKDRFGDMEELSSNERNKVRRAMNRLVYRPVQAAFLLEHGYPILKATYDDYSVSDRSLSKRIFTAYLSECNQSLYDYWGVFEKANSRLIGFCTVRLWEDSCEYGLIGMLPEYKHNQSYPYYGLFHEMNAYYLGKQQYRYVSDGARSITEHSHIQQFLIDNFHFRKAYCQLDIHYQWWMKPIVGLLYPFRNRMPFQRIKAVLNMEAMHRGEK